MSKYLQNEVVCWSEVQLCHGVGRSPVSLGQGHGERSQAPRRKLYINHMNRGLEENLVLFGE